MKVFEHDHIKHNENSEFTEEHWRALSDFNDKNENKYFTITAKGVKFSQYVGVVQIGKLTIEILPKIDKSTVDTEENKDIWHNVLLKMLKVCHRIQSDSLTTADLKLRSNSILDWYIEIFLKETEHLLHQGLVKKHRKIDGNSNALKGQLLFSKHITQNLIHKEHFFVRHTNYDRNNTYNRILNKTLLLIKNISTNPLLHSQIGRISLDFPEVSDIYVNDELFEKLKYDRKTERYKKAIEISRLLLLNYSPDIKQGRNNVIALLFDMNKLWEEYITIMLRKACEAEKWKLLSQRKHTFWNSQHFSNKRLQPDIIIEKPNNERIAIDTKWKMIDIKGPSEEDLRQVFAYGEYFVANNVYLLYPFDKVLLQKGEFNSEKFNSDFKTEISTKNGSILYVNVLNGDKLNSEIGNEIFEKLLESQEIVT